MYYQIRNSERVFSIFFLIKANIVQLTSAIRAIHTAGLAARIITPSKVILTGKNRIRLNCAGMHDVINYEQNRNTTISQAQVCCVVVFMSARE